MWEQLITERPDLFILICDPYQGKIRIKTTPLIVFIIIEADH